MGQGESLLWVQKKGEGKNAIFRRMGSVLQDWGRHEQGGKEGKSISPPLLLNSRLGWHGEGAVGM